MLEVGPPSCYEARSLGTSPRWCEHGLMDAERKEHVKRCARRRDASKCRVRARDDRRMVAKVRVISKSCAKMRDDRKAIAKMCEASRCCAEMRDDRRVVAKVREYPHVNFGP